MKALAEFVMRSRGHAIGLVLVSSFIPLANPAIVALITLRKGVKEGLLIAVWALLFIFVLAFINASAMPAAFGSLSVLTAVMGAANVLRTSVNWSFALFGLLAIAVTGGLVYASVFQLHTEQLVIDFAEQQKEVARQMGGDVPPVTFTAAMFNGVIALAIGIDALLGLMIGRWWQAALYNPGGFQQEFHQLRLSVTQSIACISLVALAFSLGNIYWAALLGLPILLVTTAIVHYTAKRVSQGIIWLVLYYIVLLSMNSAVLLVVILIGTTDSWVNYRQRLNKKFKV